MIEQREVQSSNVFCRGLASGSFAGFMVDLLLHPLDTIKTWSQVSNPALSTKVIFGQNRNVVKELSRGLGASLLVSIPSAGTFFATYDTFKHILKSYGLSNYHAESLAAVFGTVVQASVRGPFEVVKQRLQVGLNGNSRHGYFQTINCFRDIWMEAMMNTKTTWQKCDADA
eukprot:Filipodium_phascolosomae@DN2449_c0_g1_i4.p1